MYERGARTTDLPQYCRKLPGNGISKKYIIGHNKESAITLYLLFNIVICESLMKHFVLFESACVFI